MVFESGLSGLRHTNVSLGADLENNEAVFADMQTLNGPDPASLRYQLGSDNSLSMRVESGGPEMALERSKPEESVVKLRQVEVLMGPGMPGIDAIRQISVTEQTCYRWKKQDGGMVPEQLKQLKQLQKETERLGRAVSDLMLDKLILSEAARGNV